MNRETARQVLAALDGQGSTDEVLDELEKLGVIDNTTHNLIQQAKDEDITVRVLYCGYDAPAVGKIKTDDLFHEGHIFFDQKVSFGVLHHDSDIRKITTWADEPTPLGEQVFHDHDMGDCMWEIHDRHNAWVARANGATMRDIILGIPALVCAAKSGCRGYVLQEKLKDALKAMGAE